MMHALGGLVVRRSQLRQKHASRSVGQIEIGSVNQEVGKDDDLSFLGVNRNCARNGKTLRIDVAILLALLVDQFALLQWAELVASRIDAQSAVFRTRVVQMDEHRAHRVILEREVRVVLVHEVRRAFLRWLHVSFRVVQQNVRTD